MAIEYSNDGKAADVLKNERRTLAIPRHNRHGELIGHDELDADGSLKVIPKRVNPRDEDPWAYEVVRGELPNGKPEYWVSSRDREVVGYYQTLRRYFAKYPPGSHSSVAIIGAAAFNLHPFFAHLDGPRDTYEIEPVFLEWAQERQPQVAARWNFIAGDWRVKIANKKYDVFFYDADESIHLPDFARYINPGGVLLQMSGLMMTKQDLIDWTPPAGPL